MLDVFPPPLATLPELLAPIFAEFHAIRRVYVFGSVAEGTAGRASDLDLALLAERGHNTLDYHHLGYDVYARLSDRLGTDRLDVVVLNATESVELRHAVVTDGKVVFDRGDDLEGFERRVRHEYEDHMRSLRRLGIG